MFIEEVKKIVRRNEFYAAAIIIFFAVFLNFYIACDNLQGKPLSQIPSAWELTVLRNYYCYNFTDTVFSTLLPLIASIMAADVYYTELKKGITNYITTRALPAAATSEIRFWLQVRWSLSLWELQSQ